LAKLDNLAGFIGTCQIVGTRLHQPHARRGDFNDIRGAASFQLGEDVSRTVEFNAHACQEQSCEVCRFDFNFVESGRQVDEQKLAAVI
jgi:hypothetical protein